VLEGKRLTVLGVGTMGAALIKGLQEADLGLKITGTAKHPDSRERLQNLGIEVATDNAVAVAGADVVVLAVKPQVIPQLLDEAGASIAPETLVISIAAGITTATVEAKLQAGVPVVRVMPNTPCVLGCGMSVLASGRNAGESELNLAQALFEVVGKTAILDEGLMNAVTGLSGSGPAYVYLVIESLAEAGVKVGIPRKVSTLLAAQTVLGSARMVLELGAHPALLKDAVTTPAGCTVDGLMELEEGKLRVTLLKAVVKATERARELG
jgi:pyrroline-5-carboxylate reductase